MLQHWLIVIRMCRSVGNGLLISMLHLAKYSTWLVHEYMMHAVSEYVLPTLWLCECIRKALQLMRMSASGTEVWAMQRKRWGLFYTFLNINMVMTDWLIYWQLMASEKRNGWHMRFTAHVDFRKSFTSNRQRFSSVSTMLWFYRDYIIYTAHSTLLVITFLICLFVFLSVSC